MAAFSGAASRAARSQVLRRAPDWRHKALARHRCDLGVEQCVVHGDLDRFLEGMRRLGYAEGHNIRYEYWFADGALDRLPSLAT